MIEGTLGDPSYHSEFTFNLVIDLSSIVELIGTWIERLFR